MPDSDSFDERMIRRCFDLASRGIGNVSPNPPVGAVLAHQGMIIGEGFHSRYGAPHAEVEAVKSVPEHQNHLIPGATLYISLEPCCIYGKTPPCTDLILQKGIKDVRVSTLDPNPSVAGKGLEILRSHGVKTTTGILEEKGQELISAFTTNILHKRPYVILKWAQSKFGFIGKKDERIYISHPYSSTWSHSLRSKMDVIMVGARTVMIDDPALTTREAPGRSPIRAVYDPSGNLSIEHKVFQNDSAKVFYFSANDNPAILGQDILQSRLGPEHMHVKEILDFLFGQRVGIILIEGGSYLQNLFIKENYWDEAWIIQTDHPLDTGIKAPNVKGRLIGKLQSGPDTIIGIKKEDVLLEKRG